MPFYRRTIDEAITHTTVDEMETDRMWRQIDPAVHHRFTQASDRHQ